MKKKGQMAKDIPKHLMKKGHLAKDIPKKWGEPEQAELHRRRASVGDLPLLAAPISPFCATVEKSTFGLLLVY